jgi:hypothetical protein
MAPLGARARPGVGKIDECARAAQAIRRRPALRERTAETESSGSTAPISGTPRREKAVWLRRAAASTNGCYLPTLSFCRNECARSGRAAAAGWNKSAVALGAGVCVDTRERGECMDFVRLCGGAVSAAACVHSEAEDARACPRAATSTLGPSSFHTSPLSQHAADAGRRRTRQPLASTSLQRDSRCALARPRQTVIYWVQALPAAVARAPPGARRRRERPHGRHRFAERAAARLRRRPPRAHRPMQQLA